MTPSKTSPSPVVYCAGPMFSAGDHTEQLRLARTVERAGFDTYVPQRDGVETAKVMWAINHPLFPDPAANLEVTQFVRKIIFALDVYQVVERCQAIVLNADGRVPDEGSVVEASMGWGVGKPVVVFKSTPISMLGGWDNPMLSGLGAGWTAVADAKQLPAAVGSAIAAAAAVPSSKPRAGSHVAKVVALGAKVWQLMPEISAITKRPDPRQLYAGVQQVAERLGGLVAAAD